jgi:hypothetical protein
MAAATTSHGSLRMLADDKFVVLQPASGPKEKSETLSFDLNTGLTQISRLPAISSECVEVLGLVGAFPLQYGVAVVVITDAEQASSLHLLPVRSFPDHGLTSIGCNRCKHTHLQDHRHAGHLWPYQKPRRFKV